jgi:hypothetical protein
MMGYLSIWQVVKLAWWAAALQVGDRLDVSQPAIC